jgi:hypothetical protein
MENQSVWQRWSPFWHRRRVDGGHEIEINAVPFWLCVSVALCTWVLVR